jgi:hypothetical protein
MTDTNRLGAVIVTVCSLGVPARPPAQLERDRIVRCLRGLAWVEPTKFGRCALADVAAFIESGFHLNGGATTEAETPEGERAAALAVIGRTVGYGRDGLWALRDALSYIGRGCHVPPPILPAEPLDPPATDRRGSGPAAGAGGAPPASPAPTRRKMYPTERVR